MTSTSSPTASPFLLGLTGSIGMGKSTVSGMFRDEGIPVFCADEVVHRLYSPGGGAVPLLGKLFPEAIVDGAVDRARLSKSVVSNTEALKRLEQIVHPLVADNRRTWLQQHHEHPVLLLDIPLLYETGAESMVDAVAVVSAPAEVQRERVLSRPGMTAGAAAAAAAAAEKLAAILARQTPDEEKRRRADFVISTNESLQETREHVCALLKGLKGRHGDAYSRHVRQNKM